ncbi:MULTISPECIES: alpha-ketoglutarate decarboxylase [unclassified Salinibacterium]|uniref:alpha-ketoglutarate decarboxylase n=1 Tax=unclassified Salinibacterium TaxID=2632331 RepID=UPI001421FE9B|nr:MULTISPECIES: alpha-ketoglutarate decarboxylase [unclassified Salinibacterium]
MTDCGCEKARAELEEFLHRELSDQDFRDVAEHLAGCVDCSAEHLIGVTLSAKVREVCQEKAPDELRAAVHARLLSLQISR